MPKIDRLFSKALRLAVQEEWTGDGLRTTKLRRMASVLSNAACNGDVRAIAEVADRLEGRPAQRQQVEVQGVSRSDDPDVVAFLEQAFGPERAGTRH